jgi:SAM-dependent methyltransferase
MRSLSAPLDCGRPAQGSLLTSPNLNFTTRKPTRFGAYTPGDSWKPAVQLILISFVSLYLELTFIRWAPTQIRLLAYFSNYVLIAALLGIGLGMITAGHSRRVAVFFAPGLLLLTLGVLVLERSNFVIPIVSEGQFVWNYLADLPATGFAAYGILLGLFLAVVALFAFVGQEVGQALQPFRSLPAYSLNILGSLLGVIGFALVSFLEAAPPLWFLVGAAAFMAYLTQRGLPRGRVLLTGAWLAATIVIVAADSGGIFGGGGRYWSPYYEIGIAPIIRDGERIGYDVVVNKDSHQQALDLSGKTLHGDYIEARQRLYDLPYRVTDAKKILVVGAGTGNDVAAALRNAPAANVDAVEIDPVIARLGTSIHPERPYDSTNVRVIVDDARSFLQKEDSRYDLIVFGFLDSHRLFSHMSSVRLDNYVYTLENFNRVRDRLAPGGVVAVTFTVHEKWIADRIFTVMTAAFGNRPLVYQGDVNAWGTTFLIGHEPLQLPANTRLIDDETARDKVIGTASRISWLYSDVEGFMSPDLFASDAELLTDDWPFLYMAQRSIPPNYTFALLLTVLASLVVVWRTVPAVNVRTTSNWNFLLLGAAFALLETRGITEIALVFGSTWLTNTIVIGAILVMILCANLVVSRWRPKLGVVYTGLFVVLALDYLLQLQGLLQYGFWVQVGAAGVRVAAPLFFSGIIFARWFERTSTPAAALGANLVGAVIGGLLEYTSLVIGLRELYLLAMAFYGASFLISWRLHLGSGGLQRAGVES